MRPGLGIVDVVFRGVPVQEAASRAMALGFTHLDVTVDDLTVGADGSLGLPVVDRFTQPSPRPGCSTGAPAKGDGMWERAVRAFRRAPGSLVEPWPGSILDSVEAVRAFLAEVPESQLLLDTGHVATWGEDPAELAPHAGHVQLRQARRGVPQTLEGDIDFADFLARLRRAGYEGAVSVEYFDLPELGFPLDDPVAHAVALAQRIWPLL